MINSFIFNLFQFLWYSFADLLIKQQYFIRYYMKGYQPVKTTKRIYEVKKKKVGKGKTGKDFQKLIQINKFLPDGNEDQYDDGDIEEWVANNIGFLDRNNKEWGNHIEGQEWINNQMKINSAEFIDADDLSKLIKKQNKAILLETSPKSPLFNKQLASKIFIDDEFPPNVHSLTGQWGFMDKYKEVVWNKATSVIPKCKIFAQKITPKDIIQGKLGNCYFLAALAALAQRPDRIFNLFLTQQISNNKYFGVKVLWKGRWRLVDLDELFPFLKDSPVFSHAVKNQLWVMILQKAWAKLYSSYMRISSGHAQQALHDFTGAPIKFFKLKSKDLDKEQLWKYLLKASKKEYAMCASSNKGSDQKMSETGIVQGHAYTVLNAILLNYQKSKVRLLQLRNPWGKKEGFGNWNDKDAKWKKVSEQQKKRIKFQPQLNDGIFFIEFQDFLSEYRALTVAQINDNASYTYQTAKDPNLLGVFFRVQLKQTGLYSFQVDKTPKRVFSSKQQIGYRYPPSLVKIFSTFEGYKQIHHFEDDERLTSRRYSMYKGTYIVYVYIGFNKAFQKDYDVNLAIYSEGPSFIELADRKEIQKIEPVRPKFKEEKKDVKKGVSKEKEKSKEKGKTKEKEKGKSKDRSQNIKVSSVTFNYVSPQTSILQKQPSQSIINSNNVHVQVKQKRESKKHIIHIGGKPTVINNNNQDHKKHWGNNLQGQQWINQQAINHLCQLLPGDGIDVNDLVQKQVTFIEPCPLSEQIDQKIKEKKDFLDQRFPPNLVSLTGEWGPINQWKNVRWQRISKVMPNAKIFQGKISPRSIIQGFLGDCYFLAGIAALAQKPNRIFNLFLQHERNKSNYYSVKMLYKGKWITINMDDYIPWNYQFPAFSRANKDELWVILLQKAWAKIYSSFKRIQAGFPQQTLHDLTGAPIRHIYLQRSTFDMQKQWKYLMHASSVEYSMVASSQVGSDSLKSVTGIVQGHAYTLLSVAQLKFNNKIERLVQLRNPWGKGENVGKWADNDPNWKLIDEATKTSLGYSLDQDGIFFMGYQSFCKEFKIITVAQINDNASYVYKSMKDKQKNGCFFRVQILQKGKYSFQVDSTPQRTFQIRYNTNYKLPNIRFELGVITDKGYIRRITTLEQNSRTSFYGDQFEIGNYICFVRIDFDGQFQKDFDVNLAIYGDFVCHVDFATRQEAIMFSNNPKIKWQPPQPKKEGETVQWNTLRSYRRDKSHK